MSVRNPLSFFAVLLLAAASPSSAAPMPEPKLFTLKSDTVTLRHALAELTRQTGIRARMCADSPIRPSISI